MKLKIITDSLDKRDSQCKIVLYGRDQNNELHEIRVNGIEPHFYAPQSVVEDQESVLIRQKNVKEIVNDIDVEGWKGENVSKIVLHDDCDHWAVRDIAETNFEKDELFGADVMLKNQLRIEKGIFTGIEIPDGKTEVHVDEIEPIDVDEFRTRISYIDIEVDDRGEFVKDGSRPIISIVAMDSYTKEVVGFFWTGKGRDIEDCFPNGRPENLDRLEWTTTEKQMLGRFTDYIRENDPDLLTGWNFEDFDAPYILNRYDVLGVDKGLLARDGYCKISNNNRATISGRTIYDLQNSWLRTKWKQPDSKALDNVAESELGKNKVEHPGMGYNEMWEDDPELLMNYNAVDVLLCQELNEELGTLSFWRTIGNVVGVDWEDTRSNSDYIRMFCLRKLYEKNLVGPVTNYAREESDYEGAYVFDAHYGRERNVMGLDLASLYPNSMAMGNISPEMKVTDQEKKTLERAGIPVCTTPNGTHFRLDKDGIFKELVDDAIGLKEDAKTARNAATPGTEEHEKLAEEYMAKKTVTNSIYGVLGWEPFFLYDEACAESTTLLGQAVIRKTSEYVNEETVATVIYGDTDSNYINFSDHLDSEKVIEQGYEICKHLNEVVYGEFAEEFGIPKRMNRWDIEPEVLMDTFFQSGDKKFYAYKAIWEDGHWLDEPDYSIKGYSFKKSSSSKLTQNTGKKLMKAILDWEDENILREIIYEAKQNIDPDNPEWEMIGIPQGLGKEIHIDCDCENCYNWSKSRHTPKGAHERGAYFMNVLSGRAELEQGSKPKRVYLEPSMTIGEGEQMEKVDVIAFENIEDVDSDLVDKMKVDDVAMTEKILEKPFQKILEAVDVDIDAALRGQTQTGFEAFM